MAAGAIGTAVALLLFGLARNPATAIAASVLAGISWIRVTNADRMLQDHIHRLVQGTPKITHLIAADP